ncbi:MAG TPA: pyridoxal-phosphate dependent enzyme [Chitinophagaceae bacterium]|nr:pyridoxal-phosphate dependent enzyme [Chitinophagaceae bacterium]
MIAGINHLVQLEQAVVQPLVLPGAGKRIEAGVLRTDKIHATISGNKWFKLKYNLQAAIEQQYKSIVTFGGAHSNHIVAAAYACARLHVSCHIFIRGEEPRTPSAALQECHDLGAVLHFVSRELYADKQALYELVSSQLPGTYLIEEGGCNALGVKGAEEILALAGDAGWSHICCAAGTGTMMAGLVNASGANQHVTGICVLKMSPGNKVEQFIARSVGNRNYSILYDYHFGGYAKKTPALIDFMNQFYRHTGIPTDFVYTGKLMYAVTDLVQQQYFPDGSRLLIIHSGGLQGNRSLPKNTLVF